KRMRHDVVGHYPIMPGVSKTAQAFVATRCLENSLHGPMMTILSWLCKTLTPARSQGRAKHGSQLVTTRLTGDVPDSNRITGKPVNEYLPPAQPGKLDAAHASADANDAATDRAHRLRLGLRSVLDIVMADCKGRDSLAA